MKKEDLFNALSDIDENLIARAKETEEVFAEPKQFIAAKKGFSWKIPAAACVAIAGVAATIVAVMINQGGTLPYDPNSTNPSGSDITSAPDTSYIETEATTDSHDITETPGGTHDRMPEEYDDLYPSAAVYEYDGDLSEVTAIYPQIDLEIYSDYDELAGESDIVVMGTFMDNTRQDVDPNGLYNGSNIYSYNRFRIEKILKGENIVSEGEDIIIGESYGVFNNRLSAYTLLTPMIKGDSWVYFLRKTDFGGGKTLYYTVGDFQGRYAAPDAENFPLPANWDITERNISDGNIYSVICTLIRKHDGIDREPFEAEYREGLYPYTGDYSEITDADVPKNLAEVRTQYYTYEELEKASDAVVIGTFIDCPHQNVDPVPAEGPFGVAITSYNKFRVECVLSLGSTTDIEVGDVVIIQQDTAVYGNKLMSVSGLTPMIKGDSWVYFLTGNDGVFTATGDSDGRYPDFCRTNTQLPFYDNDLGVTDMAAFKQDIYDTLQQKRTLSEPFAEPSHPTAQSEADIDAYLADLYPYTGDYSEVTDYPNTAYHAFDDVKRYSTYAETAGASDIVVMGTFVSDPYQTIDPIPKDDTNIFSVTSYGKFKVEKVLKSDGSVNEGDIIIVSQPTGVCGEELKSSYGLTPIINGDSWVYFLTGHVGFYTAQEPDRRYPVPGRTNTKLPFCDNKNGVYHDSWFNEDIYGVINEKLNPQLTELVKIISDQSYEGGFDATKSGYFDISEYEDIYFHYNYEKVEAVIDGVSRQLYGGMPVINVYLCDLNGDGKREICSSVYMGSGIIDSRLYAYDVATDTLYQLENRANYDYSIDVERTALSSGKALIYDTTTYGDGKLVSYDELSISDMKAVLDENPNTD